MDLGPVIFGGIEGIISFLRQHHLLASQCTCARYNLISFCNKFKLCIINAHVAPGTVIHTDEWAAYRRIGSLSNVASHSTVNHSVNFVDPITGTHTQTVESYWNRCKTKLKRMKGCVSHQVPSYLDEFMWRELHGTSRRVFFLFFFLHLVE